MTKPTIKLDGTTKKNDDAKDDDAKKDEGKKRGRPKKTESVEAIKSKVTTRAERIATILATRDPEVAEILREDGPAMAECLAAFAGWNSIAKKIVVAVLGTLEPVFAFGRLTQVLGRRIEEKSALYFAPREGDAPPADDGLADRPAQ